MISQVSTHLRVSTHPQMFGDPVVHMLNCTLHIQMASLVNTHHSFLVREFQAPIGTYSGEYGKSENADFSP